MVEMEKKSDKMKKNHERKIRKERTGCGVTGPIIGVESDRERDPQRKDEETCTMSFLQAASCGFCFSIQFIVVSKDVR
jgi:hypothetical protein